MSKGLATALTALKGSCFEFFFTFVSFRNQSELKIQIAMAQLLLLE